MGNNWAITIGINGYRNLQRLNFAKQDAEAVRQFLEGDLDFQQVYHFSDDSPPIPQDHGPDIESQPTYGTLRRFLRVRFEEPFLRDGDNLWFFFAGHGIRHQNRDYLMPLDGDPGDIASTALPLHYVSERLRRSGADNVILLIDACRTLEGQRSGLGIGQEKQQGVITLFSCSPEESSYEIQDLQQGAFTHVLLDSLRIQGEGNCATVERLYQRLRYYVPQLTQQYSRPSQTPYSIIEPSSKNHLILLPQQATLTDVDTLKKQAMQAELRRMGRMAKGLWIRVLAVSPADPDAIEGIERLVGSQPTAPSQPPAPSSTASPKPKSKATPRRVTPPPQGARQPVHPPTPVATRPAPSPAARRASTSRAVPWIAQLSRRRLLQILGFTGGGMGTVFVGRALFQLSSEPNSSVPGASTSPDPASFKTWGGEQLEESDPAPDPVATDDRELWQVPELQSETINGSTVEFNVATVDVASKSITIKRNQAEFYREALNNDVNLDLISIPGGRFTMGSPADEEGRNDNEGPQHEVKVPAFWMGKYTVTQEQWRLVTGLPQVKQVLDSNLSKFKGKNLPVEQVMWDEAVEFCIRLSQQTGKTYRLPSEAEWEYACRAGSTTPFHVGKTLTPELANYNGGNTYGGGPKGEYRGKTTDVGSFSANNYGLYDMHGNVWEWCFDQGHSTDLDAPSNGDAWTTSGTMLHVRRGGAWSNNPQHCRSAYRNMADPIDRGGSFGFRVVCVAPRR